ncbi:MAG: DUF167 domain-containing protein [Victivallaceae bacterium]|nr:DUF167 domain-containing protein [Victivallaceae bacterium]
MASEPGRLLLDCHVQPGAKTSRIVGMHAQRVKIAIAAPPVDGKANKALAKFLAQAFQVSPGNVRLISGVSSRDKRFEIIGEDLAAKRDELLKGSDSQS